MLTSIVAIMYGLQPRKPAEVIDMPARAEVPAGVVSIRERNPPRAESAADVHVIAGAKFEPP